MKSRPGDPRQRSATSSSPSPARRTVTPGASDVAERQTDALSDREQLERDMSVHTRDPGFEAAAPDIEDVRRRIYEHMGQRGLRLTTQRMAIIEAAFSTTEHYTAEDLLANAQRMDSSVSRATVYRTLPLLVETGLLQELDLGREFKYYDPNYAAHPTHNHLICINCKRILEFEDEALEQRENSIVQSLGFRPTSKHLRVEAACESLRVSGTCQFAPTRKQGS